MSDIVDSISSAITELTAPRTLASLAEKDAEQIARVLYVFTERPLNNIPTSAINTIIAKLNAKKAQENTPVTRNVFINELEKFVWVVKDTSEK